MGQHLVSGITFVKNGISLGYPIKESIESIEPLSDEIIINVGFDDPEFKNDDGTYELLRDTFTHEKFVFIKSWWDPSLREGGKVFSQQTNIALSKARGKYCQYIQGDEVVHENDLATIHDGVMKMERDKSVQGLVFNYRHFYGDVSIYKHTRSVYRREVRLIRNGEGIKSWKDAQGFRTKEGKKIIAKAVDATIYHYGWARAEQIMDKKIKSFSKFYHPDSEIDFENNFVYEKGWGMKQFKGEHPAIMKDWIETNKNDVDFSSMKMKWQWNFIGNFLGDLLEDATGYRLGEYMNYKFAGKI